MKKNKELARIFDRIADALEFKGANVFKVVAYRKAARVLEDLVEDIEEIHRAGKLQELSGIGAGIAKKIDEYLRTGKMKKYEEVISDIPPTLLDMLGIQHLGPKTLALVNKTLGVKNLTDLKRVIKDGSLAKLPQMGEKKVENIKKGIELFEKSHERLSIAVAEEVSAGVIDYLKKNTKIKKISSAGSLRRWKETIGDIDILAAGKTRTDIVKVFTRYPGTERVLAAGKTKGSIIVKGGIQIDLRIVAPSSYGSALQYFTGSKAHNIKLRSIAKQKGMKLSEYGVFKGKKKVAGKTEQEVYKILGLKYIAPELREDRGEIEAAQQNSLPALIEKKDVKGDLQMHSTYSDSSATIKELAQYAEALGYEYILITDHSQSAKYANGLDQKRLFRQWKEIDRLNKELKRLRILKGAEVDILKDGGLDYPDTILKELDLVVASIHQGFKKNVTERICAAMENPYVDIIGHPTGRLIFQREGYVIDLPRIMEKALQTDTWLELNAYPERLDLNDVNLKLAKEMGIKISIGTDAHGVEGLLWMKFGVATARRGWLEPDDVVNTYPLKKLLNRRKRVKR
ncbi:MAG TPA: DNA polymerase/3'-5' exonuclease PolX [candidate division WOR-3 bacterium]|uniref:DNA polymerase beta n=1 Tax=candidate division WOR-3 bacterium TaxID=2052148 RepID=A0A9C9EN82_UNCW3|nr:DNA polymerase/3'-5' exonuclease PolX [candidate division WOR-3 bacterium]